MFSKICLASVKGHRNYMYACILLNPIAAFLRALDDHRTLNILWLHDHDLIIFLKDEDECASL